MRLLLQQAFKHQNYSQQQNDEDNNFTFRKRHGEKAHRLGDDNKICHYDKRKYFYSIRVLSI